MCVTWMCAVGGGGGSGGTGTEAIAGEEGVEEGREEREEEVASEDAEEEALEDEDVLLLSGEGNEGGVVFRRRRFLQDEDVADEEEAEGSCRKLLCRRAVSVASGYANLTCLRHPTRRKERKREREHSRGGEKCENVSVVFPQRGVTKGRRTHLYRDQPPLAVSIPNTLILLPQTQPPLRPQASNRLQESSSLSLLDR